ncbi:MAG: iron chelate uptake ABC transporter family permease subunit [Erysipelothrix sp.]|nr:iron chelate uptake ABC transporter family permease subunit [Erysipelothrix sp.]
MKQSLKFLITATLLMTLIYLFFGLVSGLEMYFLSLRATKLIAMVLASVAVGYSSTSFQTLTNNHILTPSIMGLDSLYLLLQTVVIFFLGSHSLKMMSETSDFLLSIGLMVGFSLILFKRFLKGQTQNIYIMVLVGMVLGQLFSGVSTFLQVLMDPNEFDTLQTRMFASFSNVNTSLLLIGTIITILVILYAIADFQTLDVLSLGRDVAINLGVDYQQIVLKTFILISILVAVSTALVGPLSFLGVIVTSLSRKLANTYKHSTRILYAVVIGILFLVSSTLLIERVFNNSTTLGVLINFIGGMTFLYLLIKER